MDTNKLEGDGFQSFAKMGDEVKRGDKLLSFDPQVMAKNRCSLATPFVFCNSRRAGIWKSSAPAAWKLGRTSSA